MPSQSLIADRYELKEPLGEGGMGIVYRAYDLRTKSYVALKTMRDATDPVAVELFSKEWGVLASISHPNIVPIRDVGEIEERGQKMPFFVMPLLPGTTLAQLIETSSPRLTVDHVVDIITQVCRGLQAAHERGLVHRDIKPTNIFVGDDDTAQIIDFGVVYLAGSQSVTGHKGTWQYMSPEQLDLKPASPVSDLFSLGVVCYETLTGRKPFARRTPAETAEAIRNYIPPAICDINPNVSRLVSMVLHKAIAKQPIHRFSSVRDFADTLQKAYHGQPIDRFDPAKIQPRIDRARKAFESGDSEFASEILTELESEGHIDPEIGLVRARIDQARRQRKIRQLLEAARTRIEQDEIPLALEKLQEVLEVDPENAEAHGLRASVEKQRNERQIESWFSLARRHLERHDFAEARQAAMEVLKIRPSDASASALLNEIQRREQDALRTRSEKEQLYSSAMRAYQNGEISTALTKLERLVDLGRQTPDASMPDRDAVYQSFYNQVRSDRDTVHNAYEEARRHLAERNFDRTLELCDEFIAKYPADAIFQALKLEAVEQQRQDLSAYIAEIGRRAEGEPDLDRKVNILKEACARYPNEQQFQQTLKLTRERRDLVHSIVAKARHYEEKGLFTEALGEWETLRKIYSKYPGIDIEVNQLLKRRDQQVRDEIKSRVIEQIDRALDAGDFQRANDLAGAALVEHPQDQELMGLERLARQGLDRSLQAATLFGQAQHLADERHLPEATERLRSALELDPKNRHIRETLVNVLAEQARPLAESGDWRQAESLVQQASEVDATHALTRSLRTLIGDGKRKEFVAQCLTEARELRDQGNPEAALQKIESGLAEYPNEPRLVQFQTALHSLLQDARREKERPSDIETLKGILQTLKQPNTVTLATASNLELSTAIAGKHPDDHEIGSLVAEIRERAGNLAPTVAIEASSPLLHPSSMQDPSSATQTVLLPGGAVTPSSGAAVQPARSPDPAPPSQIVPTPPAPAPRKTGGGRRRPMLGGLSGFHLAIIGIGICLIVAAIIARWPRGTRTNGSQGAAVVEVPVQIQTTPADAVVTVNGEVKSGTIHLSSSGAYDVVVSRLGYRTQHEDSMHAQAKWAFALDPEPIHLNLSTAEKAGKIFVDDKEKGDLQAGPGQDIELPTDGGNHVLALRDGSKEILSLSFSAKPGEAPRVSAPKPNDLIVVSSLGNEALVYSGASNLRANVSGQELQTIPPDGLRLQAVSATNNELVFSNPDLPRVPIDTGNAPSLYVGLNAETIIAYLHVQSTVPSAQLFIDGVEIKPSKPGNWRPIGRKPGTYTVLLKAQGYEDHQEQVDLTKGKAIALNIDLKPVVTTAFLTIEGGTPGAQVLIDGMPAKSLDGSGSARIEVSSGPHKVAFRKEGFQPSSETQQILIRGQETKLGASEARLKELALPPPPVVASAPAEPKKTVEPVIKRDPRETLFEQPGQIGVMGEWWISRLPIDYVFLKPGAISQFNLTFLNPGKNFLGRQRKMDWVIGYVSPQQRIVYEFDGKKLNRKAYAGGKPENASVTCQATENAFQFQISIQPSRVVVRSPDCAQPDTYESTGTDLTKGKIGIKPNVEFIIR